MSYCRLFYHIVFRTKDSVYAINEENEKILYDYIWGFVKAHQSILHRINGMPDHLHLFVLFVQICKISVRRTLFSSRLRREIPQIFPNPTNPFFICIYLFRRFPNIGSAALVARRTPDEKTGLIVPQR